MVTLDAALQKHFKGKTASGELDAVKSALDQADTAQDLARQNAPGETLALYEVMGKVLEQIEDLNRAGKTAFDGDAATRGKFNKDILLRARKAKAAKEGDEAPRKATAARTSCPPPPGKSRRDRGRVPDRTRPRGTPKGWKIARRTAHATSYLRLQSPPASVVEAPIDVLARTMPRADGPGGAGSSPTP